MALRKTRVAFVLSCFPVAGCGTVANLASHGPEGDGKIPFGGVQRDLGQLKATEEGPAVGTGQNHPTARSLVAAADLPFSLVGDVVTWPYVAAYSFINRPVPTPPVVVVPTPPANAQQQQQMTTYEPALQTPTTTDDKDKDKDKPQTLPAPTP